MELLRDLLPVAVMIVVYCLLLDFVMGRLPYAWLPHPWIEAFSNRRSGVTAWFALLNILGAIVSAVPVAFFLWWITPLQVHRSWGGSVLRRMQKHSMAERARARERKAAEAEIPQRRTEKMRLRQQKHQERLTLKGERDRAWREKYKPLIE